MKNYNTLTLTKGTESRPIHLKLHEIDEEQKMEVSIERITTNSFYINKEAAKAMVEHLNRQFDL